ncbi:MAG: sigma-70 family RNA polymerase sigma factor [Lachnospiraceae bacterium]|nr:sigma-70 family RNA polymerase sigma factor [Lachnospiraceae bacterium]
MKLLEMSDETLVSLSQKGDNGATDTILERYKPMVRKKVNSRYLFLKGAEKEDLIQEGMIGLFQALRDYKEDREASFKTFASICISGQMNHAITAATREKHQPLNNAISLEGSQDQGDGDAIGELAKDFVIRNPESQIIDSENVETLLLKIQESLSKMEWQVFCLYVDGMDYKSIAKKLNKSEKSIDNALGRIKHKISSLISK